MLFEYLKFICVNSFEGFYLLSYEILWLNYVCMHILLEESILLNNYSASGSLMTSLNSQCNWSEVRTVQLFIRIPVIEYATKLMPRLLGLNLNLK